MNNQHTPGPWRVQADPLLAKRHPLHLNRYVTTDNDMETWRSAEAEGHGDDCCGFVNNEGAIICTMPDSANQAGNAHLIAAAPELLRACREAAEQLDSVCRDLSELVAITDACLSTNAIRSRQGSTLAKLSAVNCDRTLRRVHAVIAKATGTPIEIARGVVEFPDGSIRTNI